MSSSSDAFIKSALKIEAIAFAVFLVGILGLRVAKLIGWGVFFWLFFTAFILCVAAIGVVVFFSKRKEEEKVRHLPLDKAKALAVARLGELDVSECPHRSVFLGETVMYLGKSGAEVPVYVRSVRSYFEGSLLMVFVNLVTNHVIPKFFDDTVDSRIVIEKKIERVANLMVSSPKDVGDIESELVLSPDGTRTQRTRRIARDKSKPEVKPSEGLG